MTRLSPLVLAAILGLGLASGAKAGPVDTFDVDILTASRYGLDKVDHWRPCHGRSAHAAADCDFRAESWTGGHF